MDGLFPSLFMLSLLLNNPNGRSDEIFVPDGRNAIYRVCEDGKDMIAHNGDAINRICTGRGGITGNKNPMLSDGLSRIIRWYKGRVSFETRKIHADFAWHIRFHDYIIRNNEAQNIFLIIASLISLHSCLLNNKRGSNPN